MKTLSPRECQVVEMLVQGWTQREIALKLGISRRTVSGYLFRVQLKTGQPTLLSAVVLVSLKGMVTVNSA